MAELEIKPTAGMRARVGGVVVSAMAITSVLLWLLTGGGVGLFARSVEMKTYMPDATGLQVGGPVRLSGIKVGVVKNIAVSGYLDSQRAVRVEFRVETNYLAKIPSDSQTSIGSDTLIGDKFVDIAAGKSVETVAAGSELRSEPAESAADKADLIYGLQDSLKKVDSMVAQVASPDSQVGHYVVGSEEYDRALRAVAAFEKSLRDLVARGNPAADAVFSTSLYSQWDKSLKQIDDTLQSVQRGDGAAGHLYASDEQYNAIVSGLRDLRKSIAEIRADMEKAGPGLRDEESYRKIERMLASTDAALSELNRGEGQAGELLVSPRLYESLVGSLRGIEDLVRDFRENPKKYLRARVF